MADNQVSVSTDKAESKSVPVTDPIAGVVAEVFGDAHQDVQTTITEGLKAMGVVAPADLLEVKAHPVNQLIADAYHQRARVLYGDTDNRKFATERKQMEGVAERFGVSRLDRADRLTLAKLLREGSGNKDVFDLHNAVISE